MDGRFPATLRRQDEHVADHQRAHDDQRALDTEHHDQGRRDERASVQNSLESQKITVSAPKRRPAAATVAAKEETPQEPAKKPSRWQRFKNWVKGP